MKRSLSVISAAVSGVVLALTMGACEQHQFEGDKYTQGTKKLYPDHGDGSHSAHPEGEAHEGEKAHSEPKAAGAADHAKPAESEKKPH